MNPVVWLIAPIGATSPRALPVTVPVVCDRCWALGVRKPRRRRLYAFRGRRLCRLHVRIELWELWAAWRADRGLRPHEGVPHAVLGEALTRSIAAWQGTADGESR